MFLGRLLGFYREVLIANSIGVNLSADLIIALITLPDLVISLFVGNSVAAVFIPKINSLPLNQRFRYFLKLSVIFGFIFTVLSALTYLNSNTIGYWILPTAKDSEVFLSQVRFVIWSIPLLALNSISRTFLQAENKFNLLGLEGAIFNICIIASIYLFKSSLDLTDVTIAILVGSALRWIFQLVQIFFTYRKPFGKPHFSVSLTDFHKYQYAFLTGVLVQILPMMARSLSSYFNGDGALATFNYAFKLIEFPMALGLSIVSIIVFPKLSRAFAESNHENHLATIQSSQNFILFASTPISFFIALYFLTQKVPVSLFPQIAPEIMSNILIAASIGFMTITVRGLNELYTVIFNSVHDVKTPFWSTIWGSGFTIILIYALGKSYGIIGCFLALSLGHIFSLAFNTWKMKKVYQIDLIRNIDKKKCLSILLLILLSGAVFYLIDLSTNRLIATISWAVLALVPYNPIKKELLAALSKRNKI